MYLAGVPPQGHYSHIAQLHDNPLVQTDGFRVDVVAAVSETISRGAAGTISLQTVWDQVFTMPIFPRPYFKYGFGSNALNVAFFMTLLAGGVANVLDIGVEWAPTTRNEAV